MITSSSSSSSSPKSTTVQTTRSNPGVAQQTLIEIHKENPGTEDAIAVKYYDPLSGRQPICWVTGLQHVLRIYVHDEGGDLPPDVDLRPIFEDANETARTKLKPFEKDTLTYQLSTGCTLTIPVRRQPDGVGTTPVLPHSVVDAYRHATTPASQKALGQLLADFVSRDPAGLVVAYLGTLPLTPQSELDRLCCIKNPEKGMRVHVKGSADAQGGVTGIVMSESIGTSKSRRYLIAFEAVPPKEAGIPSDKLIPHPNDVSFLYLSPASAGFYIDPLQPPTRHLNDVLTLGDLELLRDNYVLASPSGFAPGLPVQLLNVSVHELVNDETASPPRKVPVLRLEVRSTVNPNKNFLDQAAGDEGWSKQTTFKLTASQGEGGKTVYQWGFFSSPNGFSGPKLSRDPLASIPSLPSSHTGKGKFDERSMGSTGDTKQSVSSGGLDFMTMNDGTGLVVNGVEVKFGGRAVGAEGAHGFIWVTAEGSVDAQLLGADRSVRVTALGQEHLMSHRINTKNSVVTLA